MHFLCASDRVGFGFGQAKVAHFARFNELGHGTNGVLDRCLGINSVLIIEVDRIDLKAKQGRFTSRAHIVRLSIDADESARRADIAKLGRKDDLASTILIGLSHQLLVLTHSIDVGCIQESDAKLDGAMNCGDRLSLLAISVATVSRKLKTLFLRGLNSPFGMALVGHDLYVANTDAILRFPYVDGATEIATPGVKVADLPAGPLNHHWTKNLLANPDGSRLYVTVGSNSNTGENGLDRERGRAAILEIDPKTGGSRVFASGLRNPVGLAWEPETGVLWTVVNERDELGSDLVPDYLTSVKDDAFYGWPFSYWGQHIDDRVTPQRPDLVAKAIIPDYALGNHTAALGLTFSTGTLLPDQYRKGAFVGEHGSWNRIPKSGYKVIFVPFADGRPSGRPFDILTGFLSAEGNALGRPVGVAMDRVGALLVADDVGNIVWRVMPTR